MGRLRSRARPALTAPKRHACPELPPTAAGTAPHPPASSSHQTRGTLKARHTITAPGQPRANDQDRLLRAAVYHAHALIGTNGYTAACQQVIDVHALWPLIEYQQALQDAAQTLERDQEARRQLIQAAIDILRDSYVPMQVAA